MIEQIDLSNIKTSVDAKAAGLPVFKVLSDGAIKAYKSEDGVRRFTIIASSDVDDLAGDFFKEKALKRMESTAPGMTAFLNHSYNVPQDVFGAIEGAQLATRSVFNRVLNKNVECLCLTYDGVVTEMNPAAVQTHEMMMEGRVTLGASVSVLIVDKSIMKDGRRGIEDVVNLEVSIVGLPCNPTSWAVAASKALKLGDNEKTAAVTAPAPAVPDDQAPPTASDSTAEPGAGAQTTTDQGEASMSKDYSHKIARKGMFNNELARQESSLYHLVDVFVSAVYDLYFEVEYFDNKEIDPKAELELICDEFKAAMMERYLPKLVGEAEESKSAATEQAAAAEKAFAKIAKAASIMRLITGESDVTKKAVFASKEGRRNSAGDQKMIEEIHGLTVELGASCQKATDGATGGDTTATSETAGKAAPGADKSASRATGENQPHPLEQKVAELKTENESLSEIAEKAVKQVEDLTEERDDLAKLADAAVKTLEAYGLKPLS